MRLTAKTVFKYSILIFLSFICVCLIFEIVLRVFHVGESQVVKDFDENYSKLDSIGMIGANPGKYRSKLFRKKDYSLIYDVYYTIDEFGRRKIDVDPAGRDQFIIFIGDSLTIGEGVQDDENFPYLVAKNVKKYRPYNYGFHGHGPFELLAKLENYDFKSQISEKNGILVYTFIDQHIDRMLGATSVISWRSKHVYYKQLKDGTFIRFGNFETGRPHLTKFYKFLANSKLLTLLNISFPMVINDNPFEMMAQILDQSQQVFHHQYPEGRFVVYMLSNNNYAAKIKNYLKNDKVEIIETSLRLSKKEYIKKYALDSLDLHPNVKMHRFMCEDIIKQLNLN